MAFDKVFSKIYILAGLYNFSILIFCNFFRKNLSELDEIFDFNGIISILLWGLAYMSIYNKYSDLPLLNMVFFIEKLYYFIHWLIWFVDHIHYLKPLYLKDKMNGIFFTVYGIGDLLFGIFFFIVSLLSILKRNKQLIKKTD